MNDASGDVPPVAGANNSAPSANAANAKADGTSAGTAVANSDEDYLPNEVKAPRSPYELQAGSHIPIVISESVDSDMPGLVEAVVPTDVKDSISGRYTLIPAGARVLGQYVGVGGPGQTRVAVAFSRLFFPKTGKYLDLGGVPGSDQQGNSGIGGDVDMHSGRLFMTALKLAVLEAGPNLAVGQSGSVFQNPSPAEVAGQTVANSVGQIGQRILTQQVQGPTVHIRIGTRANLTVLKDIVFPGPVEE
jgi:type IV secretion system protein VirB10